MTADEEKVQWKVATQDHKADVVDMNVSITEKDSAVDVGNMEVSGVDQVGGAKINKGEVTRKPVQKIVEENEAEINLIFDQKFVTNIASQFQGGVRLPLESESDCHAGLRNASGRAKAAGWLLRICRSGRKVRLY